MAANSTSKVSRRVALGFVVVAAGGCGGGGGSGASQPTPPPAPSASGWVAGSFLPAASHAGRCVNPRSGTNPETGSPYADIQGAVVDENNWLRSWSNDLYLWYDEIVDRDPGLYATPEYFELLKTPATTASGNPKDRFHFTYRTTDWLALVQSGTEAGYGAVWSVLAAAPPRRIVVAYTHPGSPATAPGADLQRGEEIVLVDGVDVRNANTQAEVDTFVAGLYPDQANESHSFRLQDPQTGLQRDVTMVSTNVTIDPVQDVSVIPTQTGPVGYIHFTDHLLTAEQQLIDAFRDLEQQNVTDLVLDLRYNGGGFLAIASEVAYMIAGDAPTAGQTFERLLFNAKHTSINPVTGGALTPMPFFDASSTGQPLPTLNLSRVYVLTGGTTCSASESIINGLRGVNVQVIQIGSTTCGKPYGFYPEDNCGTTYFSVQFKGVNAAGFGDYPDGFAPNNRPSVGGERLPGCSVLDDFDDPLGDPNEARLEAALGHRLFQTCPSASGSKPSLTKPLNGAPSDDGDGVVKKSPWLTNRILGGQ
jgi:C-terminal processing protease CtpA/Prc